MTTIGETLRRERLQQGLDLQQVSETTKIGTRMLQAMEQNDFSKLPGGVFTRSFIRQYAVALGLQATALDEQLSHLQSTMEEPVKSEARKDVITEGSHYSLSDYNSARNSGSMWMSLVWVVLATAVGGAVYYAMNRPPATAVAPSRPAPRPAPQSAPPPESTTPAPVTAAIATPEPVPSDSPVQVILTAKDKAWVSITADGKSQYVGDMQTDEKRTVQARERVKLVAGNAGALEISLNGKPVDPIGPKGQVRVVEFTTVGAHVVPRTPKPAPLP